MYQPDVYGTALLFMIVSMMCWGSWANTMKLTAGYAFQLFYWDYVIGIIVGSLIWGFSLGSVGGGPLAFIANIRQADSAHILFAIAGGAVFNIANLLLVAAIDIAGLAVAFPVGIGLALVVGVLLNYAIAPKGHPLATGKTLTLEALARYPIVTYDFSFTGRSQINAAFTAKGLTPNVVLTALDSDVIKTYVESGFGVGIIAQMAYDPERDRQFDKIDASHLFGASTTRLALRRGVYARGFVYEFISLFAPQYDRAAIDAALQGEAEQYEL